jgi:hypothetical protein
VSVFEREAAVLPKPRLQDHVSQHRRMLPASRFHAPTRSSLSLMPPPAIAG